MSATSLLRRKLMKQVLYDIYKGQGEQVGMVGGQAGVGQVLYVNSNRGNNGWNGTPRSPFETITYALTKCVDRNDDTILVARDPSEPAYPVVINKRDIHILAWDEPRRPGADKVYMGSGAAACFEIGAQNVEIAGFDFAATNSYPGIQFSAGSYWNAAIHDNMFGRRGALQDGIIFNSAGDQNSCSIYDNVFEYMIARDGVRLAGAMSWGYIGFPGHGNIFREVTEVGINNVVGSLLSGVHDNVFALTASFSAGDAITMGTGSTGCIIDGNRCMYRVEATWTNNPYLENGNNHWGRNWKGVAAVAFPA